MPAQSVRVGAPAGQPAAGETRRSPLARWMWPAAFAVAGVVLFVCYLALSRTAPGNSDGADQVLQAWAMLHGNWLLHGWTVGDVSYYTTEIPEYMLLELIRGNYGADILHEGAAITYTLLVLLAALLARGRATGREGVVRALIAAGILLAPQLGHGVALLLSQPDHLGTQVPLLVIFLVLDRAPRRWWTPVAIGVMLTWVIVADRVAVVDAALPLAVVCGIRGCWALIRRRKSVTSLWFEFSLVAAAIAAYGVSELVVAAIRHAGGYTSLPLPTGPASSLGDIQHHVAVTIEGIFILFGADFGGMSPGVAAAIAVVHLAGLALALWGVCRALRRFFSAGDLIVPVMAAGIVLNLIVYLVSVLPVTWFNTREIAAVLPFGAVLAGRLLATTVARARLRPVLAGVLACYAAALGYGVAQPSVAGSGQPIVSWLEAHHLSTGLGIYAEANVVTLNSGGRVAVRAVTWQLPRAVPRAYESEASWYDPQQNYANFVLINSIDAKAGSNGIVIPRSDILALGGPPAHIYHYLTFTIMVWNHNLLTDLGSPPSSSVGNIP
jgi:hypothetical protein